MSISLLSVGVAIAQLLLRASDLNDTADALGNAKEGMQGARGILHKRQPDDLASVIANRLEARLAVRELDAREEYSAAAEDVASLLRNLAQDNTAVVIACEKPEELLGYAMLHGGNERRRWTSLRATPVFDEILEAAIKEFCSTAASSHRFPRAGLVELLKRTNQITEIARNLEEASSEVRRTAVDIDYIRRVLNLGSVVTASVEATLAGLKLGRLVTAWQPLELNVHKAIHNGSADGLPPYIMRAHDRDLRKNLAKFAQDGRAGMVIVTGSSCTGKTRTAYEGISAILPDWQLVKPSRGSDELVKILGEGIPEKHILWLDELKDYINYSPNGVSAAQSLRSLLANRSTPTLLVLATTWETDLQELAQRPVGQQALRGETAVSELATNSDVIYCEVPPGFLPEDFDELNLDDGRIREALATASEGQVAQVLGGGDVLVGAFLSRRHEAYSPEARAVIMACMDMRRIGFSNPVPWHLLEDASSVYLSDDRRVQSAGWARDAIREATREIRGVQALAPKRRAPGVGEADSVELHDYLFQFHLRTKRRSATPEALWLWLVETLNEEVVSRQDRDALIRSAVRRGMFRRAVELTRILSGGPFGLGGLDHLLFGDYWARTDIRRIFRDYGEREPTEGWEELRERADAGNREAQARLIERLDPYFERGAWESGDEADELMDIRARAEIISRGLSLQELWMASSKFPSGESEILSDLLAERLDRHGLQRLAKARNYRAHRRLVDLLVHERDEAELRDMADSGDERAAGALATLLGRKRDETALRGEAHAAMSADAAQELLRLYRKSHDRRIGIRIDLDADAEPCEQVI